MTRKKAWSTGCITVALSLLAVPSAHAVVRGKPVHALALYGEAKYGPNDVFGFVNPTAPKGGTLRVNAAAPTFDSLNPFSIKGVPAAGLVSLGTNGMFIEGLTTSGEDEPFAQYCLLCETMEVAEDNTWIEYTLRSEARFHDGTAVTPEDVIASFNMLMEKGAPNYRVYWGDVAKVEKTGDRKVRFHFKDGNNVELAMIMGQLPIISKAFWESHDIAATTFDTPNSTGPYRIDSFEPGRFISYKRDPNYWGKDLVITRGTYNFDEVRFEYFRDDTVAFEAFKSGAFDIHFENSARRWATGYDFPAFTDGRVQKLSVEAGIPMVAQGFMYNTRRAKFADRRVRQALNYAFDFESLNKTIFYDQYTRIRSYWQHSDLEAKGLPTPEELALLEPLRAQLPPEVFTQEFKQPTTAGDGNPRDNLLKAKELLSEAGWDVVGGQLINRETKEPFTFELIETQASLERIILPWFQNLEKLGIKGTLRVVDASQIVNRLTDFDFDVTVSGVQNSLSPGNEQAEFWGSASADRKGSRNMSGVKNPAIDKLVEVMLKAPDRATLATAAHALDRVLTWNFYLGLQYGPTSDRFGYWSKLKHPDKFPMQGMQTPGLAISNWWMDSAAAQTPGQPAAAPTGETSSSNGWLIAGIVIVLLGAGFIFLRRRR